MNDEWGTPSWPFAQLNRIFRFELDIAATEQNKKCELYTRNAFKDLWPDVLSVWCNPPYSCVDKWISLCLKYKQLYKRIVVLLPVDTSTGWYQYNRPKTVGTLFLNKRLQFNGASSSARFASMLFIFGYTDLVKEEIVKLKELGDLWLTH